MFGSFFFLPRPLLSVTGGHFELHVGFSLTEMNFPPIKMVVSNRNLRISRGKTPHFQGRMTFFWSIQLGLPWDLKSYEKNPNDLELVMQKHQKTYAKEHLKTMILYEVLRCEQLLNKKNRWCEDEHQWNKCNILKSTIMVILKWKFPQKWKTEAMISCPVWSLRVDPTLCPGRLRDQRFRRWKSTVFELMSWKSPFRIGRFKVEPLYDLFWWWQLKYFYFHPKNWGRWTHFLSMFRLFFCWLA